MKTIVKIVYILLSITLILYLFLPNPEFPSPPSDALQSKEPADTETPLRRAYFTNYTRAEVLSHYEEQFKKLFPMSMRPQSHDIIRTWAFYTILRSQNELNNTEMLESIQVSNTSLQPIISEPLQFGHVFCGAGVIVGSI